MDRSKDWLRQAEDDYQWARDTMAVGRWAQACFVCQQAAEKALKALALHRGYDRVRSHSTLEVAKALGINDDVEQAAKRLDLYYISTRYPDALPSGAPFEYFTEQQAREALQLADVVLERARSRWVCEVAEEILEKNQRDPLFGLTMADLQEELRRRLRSRVEAAYLFGSVGTQQFGPDSDVDLLLVSRTDVPFTERARGFADLLDLIPSLDVLVYTPEEFERLTSDPSAGFWRSVATSLRRLL